MEKVTSMIDIIAEDAQYVANCLRKGFEGESQQCFVALIDKLTTLTEQISKSTSINKVQEEHFNQFFSVMMNAHKNNDTLFLADILQYELMSILHQYSQ